MRANELCPSPHLEAADLDPKSDTVVHVESVGFSEVGEDKERKGSIKFKEFDRSMILNRTNTKRLITLLGGETDDWIGKEVELYASETDFGGKTVPCIRVRDK